MGHKEDLMRILDITEAEAEDIIKSDEEIDRGAKLFELTDEQKKAEKVARNTGTRNQKQKTVREKKANPQKQELINDIAEMLKHKQGITEFKIENAEREILFHFNGVKYKIVLSAPRS